MKNKIIVIIFGLVVSFATILVACSPQTTSTIKTVTSTQSTQAENELAKKVINTDKAPAAMGPYSQAIQTGNLLFVSGQIPIDPVTNTITGDIKAQTRQVLDNLQAVLAAAGLSLGDVVKTTVFLQSLNDFEAMNEVYRQYFIDGPPARSTVGVSGIPRGALVEIEAIAVINSGK